MKRNEKLVIMYLFGLLLCIFCMTMLLLIQGFSRIIYLAIWLLTAVEAANLLWYLHEEKVPDNKLFRLFLKLNYLSFPATILASVYLFLTMAAQFHTVLVPDASGDISLLDMEAVESAENCYVFQTDELYIIFPQYNDIRFVYSDCPSMKDPNLTMFATSAFFHTYELKSRHENVVGAHVSDGVYYDGAAEKNLSAFTFYDGEAHFTLENADDEIRAAAEQGGEGFEQFMAIWNGEKTRDILSKRRCYRVMAELNGRICIIDSTKIMSYADFIRAVQNAGVKTAIYLDMGAHSSHSKYRSDSGKIVNLFGKRGEFVHCWVGFYK